MCFFLKLMKNGCWLVWNHDNVYKWGNMWICRLMFQWASTIKNISKQRTSSSSSNDHLKLTCSHHDIVAKLLSCPWSTTLEASMLIIITSQCGTMSMNLRGYTTLHIDTMWYHVNGTTLCLCVMWYSLSGSLTWYHIVSMCNVV
jgi:hypothetical protein